MMLSSAQAESSKTLEQLLQGMVDVADINPVAGAKKVVDLTADSRHISPDAMFVAMPGSVADGREFVSQAFEKGAGVVVYEASDASETLRSLCQQGVAVGVTPLQPNVSEIAGRFFGDPSVDMKVTAITGTNGKTTCAWLLAQALELFGERCGVMGTIGYGFPNKLKPSALTTGDAVEVQRLISAFKVQGASSVCMEVSSHALDQDRVSAIDIDIAVFTNLTRDHIDYHQTMEAYGNAKSRLFAFESLDVAILNTDDSFGRKLQGDLEKRHCDVISYGLSNADISADNIEVDQNGIRFDLPCKASVVAMHSQLSGALNLPNLLAVTAVLMARGYSLRQIAEVMPMLKPAPGRMEWFSHPGGVSAVVDYSHTADSLSRALSSLRAYCDGDIWVVVGCGGDRDQGKRAPMGKAAATLADRVIVTNDNPRSEHPEHIASEFVRGAKQAGRHNADWLQVILDRRQAIAHAIEHARPGDMVLVAGKGHESIQTIGKKVLPFSDREVVKELLEALA